MAVQTIVLSRGPTTRLDARTVDGEAHHAFRSPVLDTALPRGADPMETDAEPWATPQACGEYEPCRHSRPPAGRAMTLRFSAQITSERFSTALKTAAGTRRRVSVS